MGFQTDLRTGFAQLLADAGVGIYRTTGAAYTAGETGIVHGTLPSTPDRVIVLATYPVNDDPTLSDSVVGLQVTTRWESGDDPRPGDDLADAVFDQLQNLPRTTLATGVVVTECLRRSGASLGQDSNNRWRRVQNFYVQAHNPSTHRS